MKFLPHTKVAEVVEHNPLLQIVFERYGMTRAWENLPLLEVCHLGGVQPRYLLAVLDAFDEPAQFDPKLFKSMGLQNSLPYLRITHRYYLENRLPAIDQTVAQLCEVHQQSFPVLHILPHFFANYRQELITHIAEEEDELFPWIESMMFFSSVGMKLSPSEEEGISFAAFLDHHQDDHMEVSLIALRKELLERDPDLEALLPFNVLCNQIEQLEADLYVHELIEEEVLLPLAVDLEHYLRSGAS